MIIGKLLKLFGNQRKVSLDTYLKKLSIDRADLISSLPSEFDFNNPINAFITFAILLREKGEYYKSLKVLENLMKQKLSEEEKKLVILNLAFVYRAAGFIDRAERVLMEGISEFPTEAFFYYELAQVFKTEGKLEEAIEYLEKAVELKGTFREELIYTKLLLADRYIDSGRTDRALRILRKLEISLPIQFYYYVLSKLFYVLGESEKGHQTAIRGILMSPDRAAPFISIMENYGSLDLTTLKELLSRTNFSVPVVRKTVEKLLEFDKKEEAISVLEVLWRKGFFDPELFETYVQILWSSGRRKRVAEEIVSLMSRLKKGARLYECESCGFRTDNFDWVCPKCRGWETLRVKSEI